MLFKNYTYIILLAASILATSSTAAQASSLQKAQSAHSSGCCIDSTGNVDNDPADVTDISDLTYIVSYIFLGGPPPVCLEESDVTLEGGADISDLTFLVSYIFLGGPPPPLCPFAGGSYTFQWTRTVSDGWILDGEGFSCDGVFWNGAVYLSGVDGSGVSVSSSGLFEFTIPTGSDSAQTTIPTSGTITSGDETMAFDDPLQMQFKLFLGFNRADIAVYSTGAGLLYTPIGPITFASVFTADPGFSVDLLPNPACR